MVRPMRVFVGIMMIVAGFSGLAVVVAFVAFGGDEDKPAAGDLLAARTVTIVTPEDGATLEARDVVITVDVDGFEVVDRLNEDTADGEGHLIFYLDVEEMPTIPGEPAATEDEAEYEATASTTFSWKRVRPGVHLFGVQLVNNDGTPLEPPALDDVEVLVE